MPPASLRPRPDRSPGAPAGSSRAGESLPGVAGALGSPPWRGAAAAAPPPPRTQQAPAAPRLVPSPEQRGKPNQDQVCWRQPPNTESARVRTRTRRRANPPCSGSGEEGSSAHRRRELRHGHRSALRRRFQGASRARSLAEKELSEVGHFILAKKTRRLFETHSSLTPQKGH